MQLQGKMDIQTTALGKRVGSRVSAGGSNCGSLNTCRRAVIGNGNRQDVSSDSCVSLSITYLHLQSRGIPFMSLFFFNAIRLLLYAGNGVSRLSHVPWRNRPLPPSPSHFCFLFFSHFALFGPILYLRWLGIYWSDKRAGWSHHTTFAYSAVALMSPVDNQHVLLLLPLPSAPRADSCRYEKENKKQHANDKMGNS